MGILKRRPEFIGIGAAKSGTTWLAEVLRAHPQIFIPPQKELNFFCTEKRFEKGLDWYLDFFDDAKASEVPGEFSVTYLTESGKAAERIHDLNKNAKLIMSIRDPVERAISHYQWRKQQNIAKGSFKAAMRHQTPVKLHSLYHRNVAPFLNYFSKERLHVVLYDDIKKNPGKVRKDAYNFLEVDPEYETPISQKRVGETINPRVRSLENLRIYLFKKARDNALASLVGLSKRTGLSTLYRNLNNSSAPQIEISQEDKQFAYSLFRDDLLRFSDEMNMDLSNWHAKYAADVKQN